MELHPSRTIFLILLLFLSLCFSPLSAFSDEGKEQITAGEASNPSESDWKLELEGQLRIRGDFTWNQNLTDFAFDPGHRERQFLERTRGQVSLGNPALNLEAVVQGQWYGRWGGTDDRSSLDLYQGYVLWDRILGSPISLKAGRQEFSYGSTFFVGTNDFYNGLSWDGLKVTINPFEQLGVDILGTKMAKLNPENPDIYLAGIYATYKLDKEDSLESYLFYNKGGFLLFHREIVLRDSGQKWFTLGARVSGKAYGFDYELEPQFQWGKVKQLNGDEKDRVRAYGGHIDLGYTFQFPLKPRIFSSYGYGSGDNQFFDGTYSEFHGTTFNDDSMLFGDMKAIPDMSGVTVNKRHASGLQVWVGGITLNPLPDLTLTLSGHRFYANKCPSRFSRDLGTEVDTAVFFKPLKGLSLLGGFDKFFTGRFYEQASGSKKNMDYFYIQVQVEFQVSKRL